jgi:hypothetical protein
MLYDKKYRRTDFELSVRRFFYNIELIAIMFCTKPVTVCQAFFEKNKGKFCSVVNDS